MSEQDEDTRTKSGFFVTIREIHGMVSAIDDKLDTRIADLTAQIAELRAKLAAYGVIIGIITVAVGAVVADALTNR